MANAYTFRSGQQKLVRFPVDSATVIAKGDMLFWDTDDAKPAGDFTWDSDLAATQAGFANVFIGIANAPSAAGETDDIDVDVSPDSVYEMTCASAAYKPGAPVGPDKASGNTLLSQALEAAVAASSVARTTKAAPSSSTKIHVSFASAYSVSSGNVNANVG